MCELSAYEQWMVRSNLETIDSGVAASGQIAILRANGYDRIATAVAQARLEHLRGEIEAERISYGEIAELASLAEHIEAGDTQLLEWAGVPEFPDDAEG